MAVHWRTKELTKGGNCVASASGKAPIGSPKPTISVYEWKLVVTNHKGRTVVDAWWWTMSNLLIGNNRLHWTQNGQDLWVDAPLSASVVAHLNSMIGTPPTKERYDSLLAAARVADAQETVDRAEGLAAKKNGGSLNESQRTALQRRRNTRLLIAGVCAGLLIPVIGFSYLAIAGDESRSNDGPPAQSSSCQRNDQFVRHDPGMDPAGNGAQIVRDGGFLVTSDGQGGSCVYSDDPLGG